MSLQKLLRGELNIYVPDQERATVLIGEIIHKLRALLSQLIYLLWFRYSVLSNNTLQSSFWWACEHLKCQICGIMYQCVCPGEPWWSSCMLCLGLGRYLSCCAFLALDQRHINSVCFFGWDWQGMWASDTVLQRTQQAQQRKGYMKGATWRLQVCSKNCCWHWLEYSQVKQTLNLSRLLYSITPLRGTVCVQKYAFNLEQRFSYRRGTVLKCPFGS